MIRLVLLRHGESTWNRENRFTGWTDVDLSKKGEAEASAAARRLATEGYTFDLAFTSVLKRAIRTLWIVLDGLDLLWLPVYKSWRLNERHYGGLQGLNKAETAATYGEEQVHVWRRSFDVRPPELAATDPRCAIGDPRYADLAAGEVPRAECLKDTVVRALPYWSNTIAPTLSAGKKIIIAAHGNSLRALIKHLDAVSDRDIASIEVPTGIPLVYELEDNLRPIRHFYLADSSELEKAILTVKNQGKAT